MAGIETLVVLFMVGASGGFCGEVLKVADLYNTVPARKFRQVVHSPFYRSLSLLLILVSGIVAGVLSTETGGSIALAFAHGLAAAPTLRAMVRVPATGTGIHLGRDDMKIELREIL